MKHFIIALFVLILAGCHSLTYTQQVEEGSYIQFSGNFIGTTVAINQQTFNIDEQTKVFDLNGRQVAKFPVSEGKSLLTVSRGNNTLISKYIFISDGQTLEVAVP